MTTDVPHWVGTESGKDNKIKDPCLTSQAEGCCEQLFITVRLLVEKLEPVVPVSRASREEVVSATEKTVALSSSHSVHAHWFCSDISVIL